MLQQMRDLTKISLERNVLCLEDFCCAIKFLFEQIWRHFKPSKIIVLLYFLLLAEGISCWLLSAHSCL